MRIIYHNDGSKTISERMPRRVLDADGHLPLSERMMRNYYNLECAGKLNPNTNKTRVKRTWEIDAARREAGLGE